MDSPASPPPQEEGGKKKEKRPAMIESRVRYRHTLAASYCTIFAAAIISCVLRLQDLNSLSDPLCWSVGTDVLDCSGNTRSQSCQLAEPLWTDPGLNSGIGVRELIST